MHDFTKSCTARKLAENTGLPLQHLKVILAEMREEGLIMSFSEVRHPVLGHVVARYECGKEPDAFFLKTENGVRVIHRDDFVIGYTGIEKAA